jgi:hypothetical protein
MRKVLALKRDNELGMVANIYNPSYLGGWDQEDHGMRPARQIVWETPMSKMEQKWIGGMAQAAECLPSKYGPLSSKPILPKQNKTKQKSKRDQVEWRWSGGLPGGILKPKDIHAKGIIESWAGMELDDWSLLSATENTD